MIAIVSLSVVATAGAAVVPPGNSAANQYTETYPTWQGNAPTIEPGERSPAQALGKRNAGRLEKLGPEGRAAAELAAATAPGAAAAQEQGSGPAARRNGGGGANSKQGGASGGEDQPSGSSALVEVLGQATGSSSSGEMGLLLPLIILATIAFAGAYGWRRSRPPA